MERRNLDRSAILDHYSDLATSHEFHADKRQSAEISHFDDLKFALPINLGIIKFTSNFATVGHYAIPETDVWQLQLIDNASRQ